MLLDAYYKIRCYEHLVGRNYSSGTTCRASVTVPQTRLCDGTYTTVYYSGPSGTAAYPGTHSACALPYSAMLSQTATGTSLVWTQWITANIIVGSGTTAPTASDYCIENEIVDGLTFQSMTSSVDAEKGTLTYYKTMTNTSGSEMTITEVGLSEGWLVGTSSANSHQVLVMRELLETPLVVPAGESFTVSVTHEFPLTA